MSKRRPGQLKKLQDKTKTKFIPITENFVLVEGSKEICLHLLKLFKKNNLIVGNFPEKPIE